VAGRKYIEPETGEWVWPVHQGYRLRCCDCGLVHRMDFRAVSARTKRPAADHSVKFRVFRDDRATAAIRREARKRGC
jgi:hypothetical protein